MPIDGRLRLDFGPYELRTLALRLAFYSQAKATYLLVAIGPLALFFGLGAAACDTLLAARAQWARPLYYGWLALFAGVLLRAHLG